MFQFNRHPDYGKPLDPRDAEVLGEKGAEQIERYLSHREEHAPTPLHSLPALADALGVGALHIKDEGSRLGLGSFKALGSGIGAARRLQAAAECPLGRMLDFSGLCTAEVRDVASGRTVTCATAVNRWSGELRV